MSLSVAEAQAALLEGRVDGIVGRSGPGLQPLPEGIVASSPFTSVSGVILGRADALPDSAADLGGRRVTIASGSALLGASSLLVERVRGVVVDTVDAVGVLDIVELPAHPDLVIANSLPEVPGRSWAVRADQPELHAALDAFLDRSVGGLDHAVLLRRYFRPDTRLVSQPDLRDDGSLSPWDATIRREAEPTELDWRLLTAQMFQESRFDPQARSPVGAYGLMQLMPETARQVGVRDLSDPEEQIRGGVRYMDWLYGRFSAELALADRVAFTLAAYNAGYGHVADARRVAERTGGDPDRWFGSVELAMLSLSHPDVYRSTTHGYVRGREPVGYVRRINELGQMYYRPVPE